MVLEIIPEYIFSDEEDGRTTAEFLTEERNDWEGVLSILRNQDKGGNGVQSIAHCPTTGQGSYSYADEGAKQWGDMGWLQYEGEEGIPSDRSKIHYTQDDPKQVGSMTALTRTLLNRGGHKFAVKVDADKRYEFTTGDGTSENNVMVAYVPAESLDDINEMLDSVREDIGLPQSSEYKENSQPETYERERGFVVREEV